MANEVTYRFTPIGYLRTPFQEKFGVPRQSGMIQDAEAILELNPEMSLTQAVSDLEGFSHLWIVFIFDRHQSWRPTIRPPRVSAPRKVGVFASRSPHRPNPIGISAVRLDRIEVSRSSQKGTRLYLSGVDFLDGTPVLDIKPYLPYADSVPEANQGWIHDEIPRYEVSFSQESLELIQKHQETYPKLKGLITEMLEWDPRPTSQKRAMPIGVSESQGKCFGFRVLDFDVQWEIQDQSIHVIRLITLGA